MAWGVGAIEAGSARLVVRPSTLCVRSERFVVPLPLLWRSFHSSLPRNLHVGGIFCVYPMPPGPLLSCGSVHVPGGVSSQTRVACLSFGGLRYGTQSSRGGNFTKS